MREQDPAWRRPHADGEPLPAIDIPPRDQQRCHDPREKEVSGPSRAVTESVLKSCFLFGELMTVSRDG